MSVTERALRRLVVAEEEGYREPEPHDGVDHGEHHPDHVAWDAQDDQPTHTSIELIDWATLHDRPDAIIDGLAFPGRWTALVAPAKTGKSLLLLAVTTAPAGGRHPFTGEPMGPVTSLYVDAEMGRLDLAERLEDLGVDPAELDRWHATDLSPRLDTPEGGAALVVAAQQLGASIVVIDGINGTVTGAEKDDTTWRPFFDHTIAPLKRLGIAVLTGDNLGKDKTLGPRGSSVKVDKPDAVLSMARTDNGVRLTATHRRTAAYPESRLLRVEGVNDTTPVRYREATVAWPAGTKEAAAILERLGVPLDHGRDKARRALREADEKVGNDALAAAIRWRRQSAGGMS